MLYAEKQEGLVREIMYVCIVSGRETYMYMYMYSVSIIAHGIVEIYYTVNL